MIVFRKESKNGVVLVRMDILILQWWTQGNEELYEVDDRIEYNYNINWKNVEIIHRRFF